MTNFKLKTVSQTDVWVCSYTAQSRFQVLNAPQGGVITMTGDQFATVSSAIASFSANNTDTKAAILPSYNSAAGLVSHAFYGFEQCR